MKLIDILVLELPKRGGWPDGGILAVQDCDKWICFSASPEVEISGLGEWGNHDGDWVLSIKNCEHLAEDYSKSIITIEQYEAALAASKPEWDGEGVPPVGADVQCICNQFPSEGQEKLLGKILYSGEYTILHTYKTNEQHHVPVESVLMTKHWSITPIRSEADKKREIGVLSLARADPSVGRFEYGEKMSDGRLIGYAWYELYDKIAAGEVAGIRIN